MSVYITDSNGKLVKVAGGSPDSYTRAAVDASNLTTENINEWNDKLTQGKLIHSQSWTNSSYVDIGNNLNLSYGCYDIYISHSCSVGADTYLRINNDTTSNYFFVTYNCYTGNTSVTGGGSYWGTSFPAGGSWACECTYHIQLNYFSDGRILYTLMGGGVDASNFYGRVFTGVKSQISGNIIKYLRLGVTTSTFTGNAKIYKRY